MVAGHLLKLIIYLWDLGDISFKNWLTTMKKKRKNTTALERNKDN